jgi:hypothetical protein
MNAWKLIELELERARGIYPAWPDDIVHAVSIVAEESGEAVQSALNYYYHGDSLDKLQTELIQTAAMCIRVLEESFE